MRYFKKKHLVKKEKCSKKYISNILQGFFGIYFLENGILTNSQYTALVFFMKKKLKKYSKIFIRISRIFKNTKKPIGVRMGKGKGAINDFYIPVLKGQMFIEFYYKKIEKKKINKSFFKLIKSLVFLFSMKLNIKIGLLKSLKYK